MNFSQQDVKRSDEKPLFQTSLISSYAISVGFGVFFSPYILIDHGANSEMSWKKSLKSVCVSVSMCIHVCVCINVHTHAHTEKVHDLVRSVFRKK